jgi:hypothetical protein
MKLYIIAIGYALIAVLFSLWMDAMDDRYGVAPAASRTSMVNFVISALWPLSIPCAMGAVAGGGWGRWHMPAKTSGE